MIMTEFEIRRSYRESRNRRKQVNILAQLNACPQRTIEKILADEMARIDTIKNVELDERRKLYDEGYSDAMIAKLTGRSVSGIYAWRQRNNLPSNVTYRYDYDEMKRLHQEGYTDREIADKVGCTTKYVSTWRWQQGLSVNKKEKHKC